MTIFLSAHPDRFGCGAAKSQKLTVWTLRTWTGMFEHSLDASRTCAPNCCQFVYHFVYVEPSPYHFVYVEPSPRNTCAYFAFDRVGYSLASKAPSPHLRRRHLQNKIGHPQSQHGRKPPATGSQPLLWFFLWISRWHGFRRHCQIFRCHFRPISPMAMHLILNPLALGHSNMTMSRVSFQLSIGYADAERSAGRIAFFD